VNLLGKYTTVSTYHTTAHFERKSKNGYELAINCNNNNSYAQTTQALLKNSGDTKGFIIYSSTDDQT